MVGTKKGVFLFWSDSERRQWHRSQHHLGWSAHAVCYDTRNQRIYAATNSAVFGALVQSSDDGGASWEHLNQGLNFAADDTRRVREVWQVQPGPAERPQEVWCGTGEAGLFRSNDSGKQWHEVAALNRHATVPTWMAGGGGLILHTIVVDPADGQRVYACVSAGGAYRSEDAGESWQPINRGVRADFMSDIYPETGQCVHKLALHPRRPEVLFQQNHCGIYRSDDRGDHWVDISEGLPSRFGFPIAVHPHDPETIYVVPLVADDQRVMPDGQMAVWCSRNAGNSWQRLSQGLPGNAWLTTLRDALATDQCETAGIYTGTTTGQLFYSRNEGQGWETLADYLPPILSVKVAQVAR
ncbi:MAG: exo-alpha-sialidase [Herpetosiphon sp.]